MDGTLYRIICALQDCRPELLASLERMIEDRVRADGIAREHNAAFAPFVGWGDAVGKTIAIWRGDAVDAGTVSHIQQLADGSVWAVFDNSTAVRLYEDSAWSRLAGPPVPQTVGG